ncbi:MAG: hypothetical protein ABMA64_39530 [Myxococcota bacterium]
MNILADLLRAALPGLALLVGLGGVGFLFGRSRAAAIALGVGIVLLGLRVASLAIVSPVLGFLLNGGMLPVDLAGITFASVRLLDGALEGAGVVACLVGISLGPAPARAEEEF